MDERNAGEIMETIPPKLKLPLKLYLEGRYGILLTLKNSDLQYSFLGIHGKPNRHSSCPSGAQILAWGDRP